jgi:2-polyprenyl-3-methyl-5-hydroxy-6-metoxy-1,4-benzoquinol methylase
VRRGPPRARAASGANERFDAAYYRRFYLDQRTRAQTPMSAARKAAFIAAYLAHLDVPVRRILDIGCGLGWTLRALAAHYARASVTGVEWSAHLCDRLGWQQGSVTDWRSRTPFDVVVCDDVLPSLPDRDCARALDNLATLCRGALFLGVLTAEDWARCDRRRTDRDVHLRPARWYRRRLAPHFLAVGGGLYLKRPVDVTVWALESLES